MKKLQIRHIIMLLAVLPAFLNSCTKDEEVKLDFDITVPDNWRYYVYSNEGWIYSAARKAVNENDTILEELVIWKESLPNFDLPLYYLTLKPKIQNSPAYDSLLYESDTLINGTSFKKMLSLEKWGYINSLQDTFYLDALTTRYFFFENKFGYNMTFISLDTTFYRNQPLFNEIMSTFHYKY
jgi:hypothetical protein